MPKTTLKVKSGKEYEVDYAVAGSLQELSREEIEAVALAAFRTAARSYCVARLNKAEPSIVVNQDMMKSMIDAGFCTEDEARAFFASKDLDLEIPSRFEIPLRDLLPKESGRGKKAADIFSFGVEEDDDEGEETPEE